MQSITQQHDFGCGIACVSFVLQKPYAEIAQHLGAEQATWRGFLCKDLVAILQQYGHAYTYGYTRVDPDSLPDGTIVFLRRSRMYPAGHYLAKRAGKWMDSWINFDEDRDISHARSGFRTQLPYPPSYAVIPVSY